jgi:Phage integrase family
MARRCGTATNSRRGSSRPRKPTAFTRCGSFSAHSACGSEKRWRCSGRTSTGIERPLPYVAHCSAIAAAGGLVLTEMKTKGSRRTLTLTARAIEALEAHKDRQEWDRRRDGWQEQDLVFCTIYGGRLDQTRIHEHWTPACAKAAIPGYRVHDLRHSVASSVIGAGMGLLEIAHMLAHRNATMVTTVYGHIAPGDHSGAAAMMEANLARHQARF